MKVYLAGPMTGHPDMNYPAFKQAALVLRGQGHEVFSPAEADIERHGEGVMHPFGDANAHPEFSLREALGIDLAWICQHADAVALLPGWEKSKGAKTEKALADALDLEIIHMPGDAALTAADRPKVTWDNYPVERPIKIPLPKPHKGKAET